MKHAKLFALLLLVAALAGAFQYRSILSELRLAWEQRDLPTEVGPSPRPIASVSPTPRPVSPTESPRPFSGVNLAVPFQAQAPRGDWSLPWQEACEETSAILVDAFWKGETLTVDEMEQRIKDAIAWQMRTFHYYEHTTAAETARMLRELYGYRRVDVVYDPTIAQIREQLQAGRPVIVPLAGRLVGNRYYTAPGPIYHMLVVKGMTEDGRIITNDVGTRHGKNYTYDAATFLYAMHDVPTGGSTWPAGVDPAEYITKGRRAIIVVYPN